MLKYVFTRGHTCDFSANSQKSANYLLVKQRKYANLSSDYPQLPRSLKFLTANFHKTLVCQFRIFGFSDLIVILKNEYVQYHKYKQNFFAVFQRNNYVYVRKKVARLKKYVTENFVFWQLVAQFANFRWNNNISKCGGKITHLKISTAYKVHISMVSREFCTG